MAAFDIDDDLVRKLAGLLDETGLTELEYTDGERRIRVSKSGPTMAAAIPPAPGMAAAPSGGDAALAAEETVTPADHPGAVTAPMVGTVYLAPEPGAKPFVGVGDNVTVGQTLCLIEAMKTFNPVRAARAGRVARILVSDASPVEYGELLIIVE